MASEIQHCPDCSGEGIIRAGEQYYSCAECKGTGKLVVEHLPPEANLPLTDDITECPYDA